MAIRVKTKENGWSLWPAVSHFGYFFRQGFRNMRQGA